MANELKICSEPVSDPKELFSNSAKSLLLESLSDFPTFIYRSKVDGRKLKEGGSPNLAATAANFPSEVIHLTWVGLSGGGCWFHLSLGFKVFIT